MQPFRIVIGYIPKIDTLPPDFRKLGLTYRLAFVQDSFCSNRIDAYFDLALYAGLMNVVRNAVDADSLQVEVSSRSRRDVSTPEEFHKLFDGIPETEREPFCRVSLIKRSSIVAAVERELWVRVGGPEPYHDSYTSAVFTPSDLSEVLIEGARAFAVKAGAELTEVIRGESMPIKIGLLDKIRNFVGYS